MFTVTLPEIVTDPMDDTIMLVTNNFNYSLTCEAFGAVSYDWERQSGSIPPNTAGINTSTLTFINLTPQDAGSYRCVATNPSGSSVSSYAQLTIQGKGGKGPDQINQSCSCYQLPGLLISAYLY